MARRKTYERRPMTCTICRKYGLGFATLEDLREHERGKSHQAALKREKRRSK